MQLPPIQPIALEFAVLILGLFMLLLEAFINEKDKRVFAWSGVSGLAIVLVMSFFAEARSAGAADDFAGGFYQADFLAMFFKRFALLTTILVLVMAIEFRAVLAAGTSAKGSNTAQAEFFALPVIVCSGLMWMASAADFIMVFVSLELVTIGFYVLVAYMRRSALCLEAGVKYLVLGALSTGFLVYGITWIYGMTGQTNFAAISAVLSSGQVPAVPLMLGVLLVLVGLGFKVAAFPFHVWVPDVYQGAPTPTAAFLSVGSKAAGFVILLRFIEMLKPVPELHAKVITIIGILAALTLVFGNLAAMPQTNLKRLFAYSSIAHAGFLLMGVAALSGRAVSFYLAAYLLMTLLGFLIMILVANVTGGDDISDFRGLLKRSPFLACAMLISVVSLAGLPFTAGFIGKFLVFAAAIRENLWLLVAAGILAVGAGFYYYLKVVKAMFWLPAEAASPIPVSPLSKFSISTLCFLIILFGVWPEPILAMLR